MDAWRSQGFVRFAPPWSTGFGNGEEPAAPPPPNGVEPGAPPSSYAVMDVLDGKHGSFLRLGGLTALRGVFVFCGLAPISWVMGMKLDLKQLLILSFGGSVAISAGMLGFYWIRRQTS